MEFETILLTTIESGIYCLTINRPAQFNALNEQTLTEIHAAAGAVFVVALGYVIRRVKHKGALEHPLIIDPPGPEEFPPRVR